MNVIQTLTLGSLLLMVSACAATESRADVEELSHAEGMQQCAGASEIARSTVLIPVAREEFMSTSEVDLIESSEDLDFISAFKVEGPCAKHIVTFDDPVLMFNGATLLAFNGDNQLTPYRRNFYGFKRVNSDKPHPAVPDMQFVMAISIMGYTLSEAPPRQMLGLWRDANRASVLILYEETGEHEFVIGDKLVSSKTPVQSISYRADVDTPAGVLFLLSGAPERPILTSLRWMH